MAAQTWNRLTQSAFIWHCTSRYGQQLLRNVSKPQCPTVSAERGWRSGEQKFGDELALALRKAALGKPITPVFGRNAKQLLDGFSGGVHAIDSSRLGPAAPDPVTKRDVPCKLAAGARTLEGEKWPAFATFGAKNHHTGQISCGGGLAATASAAKH